MGPRTIVHKGDAEEGITHFQFNKAILLKEFSNFKTSRQKWKTSEYEVNLYKDEQDELTVLADTLKAILTPFHVVLSQTAPDPFTSKDLELREKVLKIYTRARPTPFPWEFSYEPKFEKKQ